MFIAEVPELAGCAADGATRQEALANVEIVIGEWLEPLGNLDAKSQNPRGGFCSPELPRVACFQLRTSSGVSKFTERVSGSAKISAAAIRKNAEFRARAMPIPLRSAMAPTANGARALSPRPKL
jgi:hypothetical protein